jgi:hypothetical protein
MAVGSPVNFDGTNDYLTRGGILTGAVDGKIGLISFWYRDLGAAGASRRVFHIAATTSVRFSVSRSAGNVLQLIGRLTTSDVLNATFGSPGADTNWHHVIISFNLANSSERAIYLDGVNASPTWNTYTDSLIDFNANVANVGNAVAGGEKWNGDLAELFFHTPATWFDITNASNLAKFISGGAPVDLGSNGSTPLSLQPLVCLNGATASWHTNVGTAGGLTLNGALTDGAVALPGGAAAVGMVFPPPVRRLQHMLVR